MICDYYISISYKQVIILKETMHEEHIKIQNTQGFQYLDQFYKQQNV